MTRRDEERKLYGPSYPELGKRVAQLRAGSDHRAHGLAVLEAIRRLQRRELQDNKNRRIGDPK